MLERNSSFGCSTLFQTPIHLKNEHWIGLTSRMFSQDSLFLVFNSVTHSKPGTMSRLHRIPFSMWRVMWSPLPSSLALALFPCLSLLLYLCILWVTCPHMTLCWILTKIQLETSKTAHPSPFIALYSTLSRSHTNTHTHTHILWPPFPPASIMGQRLQWGMHTRGILG